MNYNEIVQASESYHKALDELEFNIFECDGKLWYPAGMVKKFEAENRKLLRFLQKTSHSDVRAKIHYVKGVTVAPGSPIACKCDALYPPWQRCPDC